MARRQLYEEIYGELFQTQSSEFSISQQKSRYLQQLANCLATIRTGRLDSSFDEFLQECWKFIIEKAYLDTESVAIWIFTHRHLIKGLLHAMVDNQPDLELFALSTSLQIFEATYRATPMAMVNAYASKVTDPCTDSNMIRVECLELLEKLRSRSITNGICNSVWPAEAISNMMTSVLYDSSVRVRRAAFQLLLKIEPSEVDEKELLYTVFLKTRDVDEKVKILASQTLVRFPMKVLHSNLSSRDWKLLFQNVLSHEGTQIHCIAKDFLFKYLSSDSVLPSRRLKALDYGKGENYIKYGNLMGNLIAEVFEMEVSFLDSYSCDDSYDEDHDVSA